MAAVAGDVGVQITLGVTEIRAQIHIEDLLAVGIGRKYGALFSQSIRLEAIKRGRSIFLRHRHDALQDDDGIRLQSADHAQHFVKGGGEAAHVIAGFVDAEGDIDLLVGPAGKQGFQRLGREILVSAAMSTVDLEESHAHIAEILGIAAAGIVSKADYTGIEFDMNMVEELMHIMYPDAYKKKLSTLRTQQTKLSLKKLELDKEEESAYTKD